MVYLKKLQCCKGQIVVGYISLLRRGTYDPLIPGGGIFSTDMTGFPEGFCGFFGGELRVIGGRAARAVFWLGVASFRGGG